MDAGGDGLLMVVVVVGGSIYVCLGVFPFGVGLISKMMIFVGGI
jgi:hypothetical protein